MTRKEWERLGALKLRLEKENIQWGGYPATGCADIRWLIDTLSRHGDILMELKRCAGRKK